ncbi:alpha/beta hydrolase [Clostridiales bacterium COT073_COT-073]|nr:alpha/beta hydrolase [Clostridiales bacterium COT073_COT-073]
MKRTDFLELESLELLVPYTKKKRRVRVLLPMNYFNEDISYPVVYMHDGQNVFYSREAFSGYSWKTIPTIKRNADLPKMIVVGIDNGNENRLSEYSPWQFENDDMSADQVSPLASKYGEFVVDVVKPYIDQHYRTKPEREFTAILGSSLGGSISQYLGAKYSDTFGCLGIFSSANWLFQKSFDNFIKEAELRAQKVFIMVGTNEYNDCDADLMAGNINQHYIDSSLSYYRQLLEKGVDVNNLELVVAAGEKHHEKAWAKYLPRCLKFLSTNW